MARVLSVEFWRVVVDREGAVALGLLMPGAAPARVSELVCSEKGAYPSYEQVAPWNYRPSLQTSQRSRGMIFGSSGLVGVRMEKLEFDSFTMI